MMRPCPVQSASHSGKIPVQILRDASVASQKRIVSVGKSASRSTGPAAAQGSCVIPWCVFFSPGYQLLDQSEQVGAGQPLRVGRVIIMVMYFVLQMLLAHTLCPF